LASIATHPVNEQFAPLTTLGESQGGERGPQAGAEDCDAMCQGEHLSLLLCLCLALPELLAPTLLGLGQFVPFPLACLAPDAFGQRDVEQAGVLALALCERLAQGALARLEGLRTPLAALDALEFMENACRVGEHLTAVLPDQRIERLGAEIPGNTAFPQGCAERVGPPPTPLITLSGLTRPPRTGPLTLATAHQPAQQVRIGGIIAPCAAAIPLKPRLRGVKQVWAPHCRDRDGPPVLGQRGPRAHAWPHWAQGGFALSSRQRATLPPVGHAGIDWMAPAPAHAGGLPPRCPPRRRQRRVTEPFGDARERAGPLRLGRPGKDLAHHRRFDGIKPQAAGGPRAFRVHQVPRGRDGPGEQESAPDFGVATAAQPVSNACPCIFGHGPAHLEQPLLMGGIPQRTLQQLSLAPVLGQRFEEHHLLDSVACPPIRGGKEEPLEGAEGGAIASLLHARPIQLGAAVPSSSGAVVVRQMPVGLPHAMLPQAGELLCNRLLLLLSGG
jgi:hypothetical protein